MESVETAEGVFVVCCNIIRRGDFEHPLFLSFEEEQPDQAKGIRQCRESLLRNQKTYSDYKAHAEEVYGEYWRDAEYVWIMEETTFAMMLAVGDYAAAMQFMSDNRHLLEELDDEPG